MMKPHKGKKSGFKMKDVVSKKGDGTYSLPFGKSPTQKSSCKGSYKLHQDRSDQ